MRRMKLFWVGILMAVLPTLAIAVMPVVDYLAIYNMGLQLSALMFQTEILKQTLMQLDPKNDYQWSNAQGLINDLGNTVAQTNGIAYNAADLDAQFKTTFPGYKAPSDYGVFYRNTVDKTINTLNGVLQSVGMNAQDFQNENTRLAFLQSQVQNAQGQTQAIQAASQIASEMVTQQQLLRQALLAQTNAQTTYYAAQLQKEASARAELSQVIGVGSTDVPEYGTSGRPLELPTF